MRFVLIIKQSDILVNVEVMSKWINVIDEELIISHRNNSHVGTNASQFGNRFRRPEILLKAIKHSDNVWFYLSGDVDLEMFIAWRLDIQISVVILTTDEQEVRFTSVSDVPDFFSLHPSYLSL